MQVRVENFAQLRDLCWDRPTNTVLDGRDALAIYERNWRFVDHGDLTGEEQKLLDVLVARYGNGVLNV
jgi:hypothetical protein